MEVDTGQFQAITARAAAADQLGAEVAAQSRKITALNGKVTVMSAVLRRLDEGVERLTRATELGEILARADMPEPAAEVPLRKAAAKAARHARRRGGLHVIRGGDPQ